MPTPEDCLGCRGVRDGRGEDAWQRVSLLATLSLLPVLGLWRGREAQHRARTRALELAGKSGFRGG